MITLADGTVINQVAWGGDPWVFVIDGYGSESEYWKWQQLIEARYPMSSVFQVLWPSGSGAKNPVHRMLRGAKDWLVWNQGGDTNYAEERAKIAGIALADYLASNTTNAVLIGHSLGCRVAAVAACDLAQRKLESPLDSVHLLGAAISRNEGWGAIKNATKHGVFNYYSELDPFINGMYNVGTMRFSKPVGAKGFGYPLADGHSVTDIDVTEQVGINHLAYRYKIKLS